MSLLTHSYKQFAPFERTKLGASSNTRGHAVTFDSAVQRMRDKMDREILLRQSKAALTRDPVDQYIADKYKDLTRHEPKVDYRTIRKTEKREEDIKEFLEELERKNGKYGRNVETNEEKLERKLEKSHGEIEKVSKSLFLRLKGFLTCA